LFHAVVAGAREFGAALPIVPVSDTIHMMNEDATIAKTLDRTMLGAAQTPQCFRAELLREIEVTHQRFEAKLMSYEEFEEKKAELLGRLPID
jgi:2-C-methyl-D-erythritol 4-phosphate cytidylyltransferase